MKKPLNKITLEIRKKIDELTEQLPQLPKFTKLGYPAVKTETKYVAGTELNDDEKKQVLRNVDGYNDSINKARTIHGDKIKAKLIDGVEKEKIREFNNQIVYPKSRTSQEVINHKVHLIAAYQKYGMVGITEYVAEVKANQALLEQMHKAQQAQKVKLKKPRAKKIKLAEAGTEKQANTETKLNPNV